MYPWLNTTFEVWLLVSNVAYLFDQTPFYRPWLSWIGVDIRRLGVEDFVRLSVLLFASLLTRISSVPRLWKPKIN